MNNIYSDLLNICTKLNEELSRCNESLVKNGVFADNICDIGNEIELIGSIFPLLEKTISKLKCHEIKTVRQYAFYDCTSLTSIDLPVCSYVGNGAFSGCTSLVSVNLPVCSYVGSLAFAGCTSLTSIDLPVCSYIDTRAFSSCTSLTSIDLPVCSYVGNEAFNGCKSLTSIDLPVCSYIGTRAFYGCTSLTSIDLPVCSYVLSSAFEQCRSLTSIILRYSSVMVLYSPNALFGTPMSKSTFTGSFGSIYVPASLVDAYKTALNWSAYADRITAIPE